MRIVTRLRAGWITAGAQICLLFSRSRLPSDPSNLILNRYWVLFPRGQSDWFVSLHNHHLLVLRLNGSGAILHSPNIYRHKVYKDNFTSTFIAWFFSSFSLCYIANTNLVASSRCTFITTISTCGRISDAQGECRAEGVHNKPVFFCVRISFMYREYEIWYRIAPRGNQNLNDCRVDNLLSAANIKVPFL